MVISRTVRFGSIALFALAVTCLGLHPAPIERTPIVLDTDIGTDVDDAFALAMVIQSKGLDLQAVTTVSGDTRARARIAAKMLASAGLGSVPVAAGQSRDTSPLTQARWADGFTSPSLVAEPAVELLRQCIDRRRGRLVIVAIGALTNVASLLQHYPQEKKGIREIVLMGGSVTRGYTPGSGQTRESNIASDIGAAQQVFTSGIPIRMAPLDVTAGLQMEQADLDALFAHGTPLTDSLRALYVLWGQPVPTLHDPMAVSLLTDPSLSKAAALHIRVDDQGFTQSETVRAPNATVAVETSPRRFLRYYESLFSQ